MAEFRFKVEDCYEIVRRSDDSRKGWGIKKDGEWFNQFIYDEPLGAACAIPGAEHVIETKGYEVVYLIFNPKKGQVVTKRFECGNLNGLNAYVDRLKNNPNLRGILEYNYTL